MPEITGERTIPFPFFLLFFIFLLNSAVAFAQAANEADTTRIITELDRLKADKNEDGVPDLLGDTVTVSGTANISSGALNEKFLQIFIQQDSSGLSLFSDSIDEPVRPGDSLVATGVVQDYFGLIELKVSGYRVYPESAKMLQEIPLKKVVENPPAFEGMLTGGTGTVTGKGERFNGKYLMVSPLGKPDKSIMAYVTNFHADYKDFDFESISKGDELHISGILSKYEPDKENYEEIETKDFKIHLRSPDDLSIVGISKYQMVLWGSIGIVVVLLIFSWIISIRSTVKHKTRSLEESLENKEVLLKEIHHRVKNNLAIMSGLFELQLEGAENKETRKVLRDGQSRLKSMALVHDKLYKTSNLKEIEMSQYIRELIKSLHNMFVGSEQNIDLHFNFDDVELDISRAIPCGLLINEIVVNAFKHAFNTMKSGTLTVTLKKKNGTAELSIADNGNGIPDNVNIEASDSLGMRLIDTFKNQLDAEMEISNTTGTKFTFTFSVE